MGIIIRDIVDGQGTIGSFQNDGTLVRKRHGSVVGSVVEGHDNTTRFGIKFNVGGKGKIIRRPHVINRYVPDKILCQGSKSHGIVLKEHKSIFGPDRNHTIRHKDCTTGGRTRREIKILIGDDKTIIIVGIGRNIGSHDGIPIGISNGEFIIGED